LEGALVFREQCQLADHRPHLAFLLGSDDVVGLVVEELPLDVRVRLVALPEAAEDLVLERVNQRRVVCERGEEPVEDHRAGREAERVWGTHPVAQLRVHLLVLELTEEEGR